MTKNQMNLYLGHFMCSVMIIKRGSENEFCHDRME